MAPHPRFRQKHVNAFITDILNNFGTFISWSNWLCIENTHRETCVLFLCIDVNEVTFLCVTTCKKSVRSCTVYFNWCDGNCWCTWFFQTTQWRVKTGRRQRRPKWSWFMISNDHTDFPLFSSATPLWPPWLLWNIACNAKILEPQAELRVETWCDIGIIRQKFLPVVMVGSTTQHSVLCTVVGLVAVTHSCCEHLFSLFDW